MHNLTLDRLEAAIANICDVTGLDSAEPKLVVDTIDYAEWRVPFVSPSGFRVFTVTFTWTHERGVSVGALATLDLASLDLGAPIAPLAATAELMRQSLRESIVRLPHHGITADGDDHESRSGHEQEAEGVLCGCGAAATHAHEGRACCGGSMCCSRRNE